MWKTQVSHFSLTHFIHLYWSLLTLVEVSRKLCSQWAPIHKTTAAWVISPSFWDITICQDIIPNNTRSQK
jgi:hypothetical protein